MIDPTFIDLLRSWHNFYFMIGGAAAGLLGLMFVALSLGQHLITLQTSRSIEVFSEPNVYYFVTALLISCVMLVPSYTPAIFSWLVLIGGMVSMARAMYHGWLLFRMAREVGDFDLGDWVSEVILPLFAFALIPAAGVCFVTLQWTLGFALLAIGTVLVLVAGIINTWGMVISILYQQKEFRNAAARAAKSAQYDEPMG